MFDLLRLWSGLLIRLVRSRGTLLIENLALRQQLAVFKRQNSRPRLATADKIFWVLLLRSWSLWKTTLVVVSPDTVVRWHRAGFQWYWRFISRVRKHVGRRPVTKEIRELIFQMVAENPTWRAPRIHGELAMLGFDVSERSVSRWMQRSAGRGKVGGRVSVAFTIVTNAQRNATLRRVRPSRMGRTMRALQWLTHSLRRRLDGLLLQFL